MLLLIRAFASGSVALTGTEAIANGVPAFKPPEPRNAATTLTVDGRSCSASCSSASPSSPTAFGIVPGRRAGGEDGHQPGRRQRSTATTRSAFYLYQAFTALILFLAANTSFNAFPRLAAILARDGYMPRQFSFRGDRLAFTSGIVILSIAAIALIVAFGGITTALIPLYAVGVFIAFTIGQTGMVLPLARERSPGWRRKLAINGFGAVLTFVVFFVVLIAKAPTSLLVAVIIPILDRGDAVHQPAVPRVAPSTWRCGRTLSFPAPRREERVIVPDAGHQPRRRPGGQRRPLHRARTSARCSISDEPEEAAADSRALGAPAARRAAGHRRVAVSRARRPDAGLPRRPRRDLARRQGRRRSRSW